MTHGAYGFDDETAVVFRYYGTWEPVFDKIRQRLPLSTYLHMDYVAYQDLLRQELLDTSGFALSSHWYAAFSATLLPSSWFPTRQDGILAFGTGVAQPVSEASGRRLQIRRGVINPARDTEDGDGRALMRLVEEIEGRG